MVRLNGALNSFRYSAICKLIRQFFYVFYADILQSNLRSFWKIRASFIISGRILTNFPVMRKRKNDTGGVTSCCCLGLLQLLQLGLNIVKTSRQNLRQVQIKVVVWFAQWLHYISFKLHSGVAASVFCNGHFFWHVSRPIGHMSNDAILITAWSFPCSWFLCKSFPWTEFPWVGFPWTQLP